jgi:predicted esterase
MSTWEAQYFAATAVHAGAFKEAWQMSVAQGAKRKIPIAMFSGTADPFFPIKDVRATRDAFQAAGIPVLLTEMKGHDHSSATRNCRRIRATWSRPSSDSRPG